MSRSVLSPRGGCCESSKGKLLLQALMAQAGQDAAGSASARQSQEDLKALAVMIRQRDLLVTSPGTERYRQLVPGQSGYLRSPEGLQFRIPCSRGAAWVGVPGRAPPGQSGQRRQHGQPLQASAEAAAAGPSQATRGIPQTPGLSPCSKSV